MRTESCKRCRFGVSETEKLTRAVGDIKDGVVEVAEVTRVKCHRYPPAYAVNGWYWVAMSESDWCGEWVPRREDMT